MKATIRQINENLSCSYTAGEISALTRIIATELLGVSQMAFYLKDDITLTAEQQTLFDNAIERLKKQEPIQYILGYSDFCG
jgi:release factor glutamine methyltransferase